MSIPHTSVPLRPGGSALRVDGIRAEPADRPQSTIAYDARGPKQIQINYPIVNIPVEPVEHTAPWRPHSAGQHPIPTFDGRHPFPYLRSHTGANAQPTEEQIEKMKHTTTTSPPRARAARPRSTPPKAYPYGYIPYSSPPSRSRSTSRSRDTSLSPGLDSLEQRRSQKHPFLRSHTGGHAHPDLPQHYVPADSDGYDGDEPAAHPASEDMQLHLVDQLLDESQEEDTMRSLHQSLEHLSPIPPTRYPFHRGPIEPDHPQADEKPTSSFDPHHPTAPAPHTDTPSTALGPPGTLASYIERFRTHAPQPAAARATMPHLWWAHPSATNRKATTPTPALAHLSMPSTMSTADQLKAMEQHIADQRAEKQRAKEKQAEAELARKQQQQENIDRLSRELRAEQERDDELKERSLTDTSDAEQLGDSLTSTGELSMLDGINASMLVPAPTRIDDNANHRQPKNSVLDDSDDFSGLLGGGVGSTSGLASAAHPATTTSTDVYTADVDDLLSKWRAKRAIAAPAPVAPSPIVDPVDDLLRRHRSRPSGSPIRSAATRKEPNSPEVEQLIQRLKKRLGIEQTSVDESRGRDRSVHYPRQFAVIPGPREPSSRPSADELSARALAPPPILGPVHRKPSGTPFKPIPTMQVERIPLCEILPTDKPAERDYLESARRIAKEESPEKTTTHTSTHDEEDEHIHPLPETIPPPTHITSGVSPIVPPLQLPSLPHSPPRPMRDEKCGPDSPLVLHTARSTDFDPLSSRRSAAIHDQPHDHKYAAATSESANEDAKRAARADRHARKSHKKEQRRVRAPQISIHISGTGNPNDPPLVFVAPMEPLLATRAAPTPAAPPASALEAAITPALNFITHDQPTAAHFSLPPSPARPPQSHSAASTVGSLPSALTSHAAPVHEIVTRGLVCDDAAYESIRAQLLPVEPSIPSSSSSSSLPAESAAVDSGVAREPHAGEQAAAVGADTTPPMASHAHPPTIDIGVQAPTPTASNTPQQDDDAPSNNANKRTNDESNAHANETQTRPNTNPSHAAHPHGYPLMGSYVTPVPMYPPSLQSAAFPPPSLNWFGSMPMPFLSTGDLSRLCADLGMTLDEYYADPPLQLLVHQLARLQAQQMQATQMDDAQRNMTQTTTR